MIERFQNQRVNIFGKSGGNNTKQFSTKTYFTYNVCHLHNIFVLNLASAFISDLTFSEILTPPVLTNANIFTFDSRNSKNYSVYA